MYQRATKIWKKYPTNNRPRVLNKKYCKCYATLA